MTIRIHTDGGARGNPGPAAVGIFIERLDEAGASSELFRLGKVIGESTNNIAEYTAVVEALLWVEQNGEKLHPSGIHFFLDSLLVVQQINGIFKVKNDGLRMLLFTIRTLEQGIHIPITYTHIRREYNSIADSLVNQALDASQ